MTHNKLNGATNKVALKTQSTAFTAIPAGLTYAKRVGSAYLFVYSANQSTINGAYSKPKLSSHDNFNNLSSFSKIADSVHCRSSHLQH